MSRFLSILCAALVCAVGGQAATWTPATSAEFQAVLDSTNYGDVIQLPAGAQFVGNFTLKASPNRLGAGFITITTAPPAAAATTAASPATAPRPVTAPSAGVR